jgi:pimeloyl-ACP methyl ester carboxylesterase
MKVLARYKKTFFVLLIPFIVSSCAFIKLQEDLDKLATSGTIHGKIINHSQKKSRMIIIVYNNKKELIKYKFLQKQSDYFAFILPAGERYHIALFTDLNNNLKLDKGEPSAYWANPEKKVLAPRGNILANLIINSRSKIPSAYNLDIRKTDKKAGDKTIIRTGDIADLDNIIFSPEYGEKGLWTPLSSLEKNGLGVYFMEKYDPKKIPILFIYGIGGYPQSWKSFFKEIDRTRYQPWFYYYPSGFRIGKAGNALTTIMNELHLKYKFKSMFILAHSMGGLVAYDFIQKSIAEKRGDYIKLFISISTPWKGDKDAEWAKHAPAVIPCWKDLMPGSPFIKNVSPDGISKNIPYYLLFSFHGDRKPFRVNNDNIVYITSELRFDMQKRAEKIFGFDLTHTEILKDKNVIDTCNAIFAKHTK